MVKMIDQFDHKIMLKKFWFGKQKFKKAKKKNDKDDFKIHLKTVLELLLYN